MKYVQCLLRNKDSYQIAWLPIDKSELEQFYTIGEDSRSWKVIKRSSSINKDVIDTMYKQSRDMRSCLLKVEVQ